MEYVKQKAWTGLGKLVVKARSGRTKYLQWYLKRKDDGYGRERIATDKYGNNYYQYYSFHGLPTRRIVLYKFFDTNKFHQDVHFVGWLRKQETFAPTPEQLENLYLEHDAFVERGIEWDRKELKMIRDWEEKKKQMDADF